MSSAFYLADRRTPPFDPLIRVVDSRTGWPLLSEEGIELGDGTLSLAVDTSKLPDPLDSHGTFGGLRTPQNVCVDAHGRIWLVTSDGVLKILDPCSCAFVQVPCSDLGLAIDGERRPALTCVGNDVYVLDPIGGRIVAVYAGGPLLRQIWKNPKEAGLANPWTPTSAVIGPDRCLWVADRNNGVVHRFTRNGKWRDMIETGTVLFLAIGRSGTVYACDEEVIKEIGPDGVVSELGSGQESLLADFGKPPIPVDVQHGTMQLGPFCGKDSAVFDFEGSESNTPFFLPVTSLLLSGTCVLGPFDSRIDACVWDRLTLRGDWPEKTITTVLTYGADVERPAAQTLNLPQDYWTPAGAFSGDPTSSEWDCLVKSQPGRYLWIQLKFSGTGVSTPKLDRVVIDYPRNTYRQYLPEVYSSDPVSAEFLDRFVSLFERTLRNLEHKVDNLPRIVDPMSAPWGNRGDYFRWLGSWIGFVPSNNLSESRNRELLRDFGKSTNWRGTKFGLYQTLTKYLGYPTVVEPSAPVQPKTCRPARALCPPVKPPKAAWQPPPMILEHFCLRRWMELSSGTLGGQAQLWGKRIVNRSQLGSGAQTGHTQLIGVPDPHRDPFHVFAHRFTVFIPGPLVPEGKARAELIQMVAKEAPSGTQGFVEFVDEGLRVGVQSMLGYDTVIGKPPRGTSTLGEPLNGTQLGGRSDGSLGISRIGQGTILN